MVIVIFIIIFMQIFVNQLVYIDRSPVKNICPGSPQTQSTTQITEYRKAATEQEYSHWIVI